MTILPIPYISQIASGRPANDCGPACALMVARAYGLARNTTIDDVYAQYGLPDEPLSVNRVMGILRDLGVACHRETGNLGQLRNWLDARTPPILLVDLYGGHFAVATGYSGTSYTIHDPYKAGVAGRNNVYTTASLEAMWGPHSQYNYTAIVPAEALGGSVDIDGARTQIEAAQGALDDLWAAYLIADGKLDAALLALEGEPEPPAPPDDMGEYEVYGTNNQSLFVRDAPGGAAVGRLWPGDVVTVYEESGAWLRHSGGGWSHGDYLRPT